MIRPELAMMTVPTESLTLHPKNVRQGDVGAISESLKEHGQYRPVVVQKSTNYVLAGNHTLKAARALGWERIAATFVDCDDDTALRILLVDNKTTDLASYDDAALADVLKELAATEKGLQGTMYDGDDLDQLLVDLGEKAAEDEEELFTTKVAVPQYEIVGEEPDPKELVNVDKVQALRKNIERIEMPEAVKEFLLMATWRHARFNYRKIAEFYPHQTAEIQRLMEESALVIIDANDAIANGFASLRKTFDALLEEDRD